MENSTSDSITHQTENIGDYNRLDEKRDTSPGRPGKKKLEALLNGHLKIKMTDGRVLIGIFLCTDRDANVILGSCSEYLREEDCCVEEPRTLGLVMVPVVCVPMDVSGMMKFSLKWASVKQSKPKINTIEFGNINKRNY